jgi:hypothetical protein
MLIKSGEAPPHSKASKRTSKPSRNRQGDLGWVSENFAENVDTPARFRLKPSFLRSFAFNQP